MSFWPTDTAGQIADVTSAVAFVGSVLTAVYARLRGNATDKAVRGLRHDFERRDLLPHAAERYQNLYRELAPFLSGAGEPHEATQKMGELRGVIVTLEAYLDRTEKVTLTSVKERLILIEKEPTSQSHLLGLLGDAAALSAELEGVVKRVTWNSQS